MRGFATSPSALATVLAMAVLLAGLNTAFLILRAAGAYLSKETIAAQLRAGFRDGAATVEDWPADRVLGFDQYTDCVTFELALVGNDNPLLEALAPRLIQEARGTYRCLHLMQYLDGVYQPDRYPTYTRYWHGGAAVTAAMLQVVSLANYRSLLMALCYVAIGFAGLCAARGGVAMLIGLAPIFIAAMALSGINGFGNLVSHAPPFIAMWIIAGVMMLLRARLTMRHIFLFGILAGAIEAFLDMLTIVPLSAAIFVIVANAIFLERLRAMRLAEVGLFNLAVVVAWACGFLGTYVSKVVLSVVLLGWQPVVVPLVDQLMYIMGTVNVAVGLHESPDLSSHVVLLGRNLLKLGGNLWRLGYGERSIVAAASVAMLALSGWVVTASFLGGAIRRGQGRMALVNGAGFVAASCLVFLWFAALPEHTFVHAWFMVRATVVWIAGGWCWAFTEYYDRKTRPPRPGEAILTNY